MSSTGLDSSNPKTGKPQTLPKTLRAVGAIHKDKGCMWRHVMLWEHMSSTPNPPMQSAGHRGWLRVKGITWTKYWGISRPCPDTGSHWEPPYVKSQRFQRRWLAFKRLFSSIIFWTLSWMAGSREWVQKLGRTSVPMQNLVLLWDNYQPVILGNVMNRLTYSKNLFVCI